MGSSTSTSRSQAAHSSTQSSSQSSTSTITSSSAEDEYFNRIAIRMDLFHSSFRSMWETLHSTCTSTSPSPHPKPISSRSFINLGLRFCQSLEGHHRFEEAAIFPVLAIKMPVFRDTEVLLAQHEEIHVGLKKLEHYLWECQTGERGLSMGEVKGLMDGFGKVLWEHLDEEVVQLGGANMRRFYTLEEFRNLPI